MVTMELELRPISPDDEERLAEFHRHLSAESIRRRYFTPHPVLTPDELHRFTNVDGDQRLALVAIANGEIVGVGRYESLAGTDDVEVAFVVRDDFQRQGIGTRLVQAVAAEAAKHGKARLVAETLPENRAMLRAFHHLPGMKERFGEGVVDVSIPLGDQPLR